MRTCLALAALTVATPKGSAAADRTAWRWQQAVVVEEAGLARLDLPPETLDASQPSLADLRLVGPAGAETPYLIDRPQPARSREQAAREFKASMVGEQTVLEAATGVREPIEAIVLETPAREFLKSATVEARSTGGDWQTLAANEVVFRQLQGAVRLRIPVARQAWDRIRVTLDDGRTSAVPFTGLRIVLAGSRPSTLDVPVTLGARSDREGTTRVDLDLGAANLTLAEVRFDLADPVFSRRCTLLRLVPTEDGSMTEKPVATGSLYRVVGENGATSEQLAIPVNEPVPSRTLILKVDNGDSPPLAIRGATATRYPASLRFHAAEAGTWRLLTGNPQATAPRYDLALLRGQLDTARANPLAPGPLAAKTDYKPPPTLPGIDPVGAAIDLSGWSCRRPVEAPDGGVVEITPDARTLARSRTDLADLRLIQGGRQVPFLIMPARGSAELGVTITDDADPERSTVSRWLVTLPVDGLPAQELRARSSAPLFTRTFVVATETRDEFGNRRNRTFGSATWRKAPPAGNKESELQLSLRAQRLPQSFHLETENGDNPPIAIDRVAIRYKAPPLVFKLTGTEPLFLYYGNREAAAPRYDLGLLRDELLAAEKSPAILGTEETLRPDAFRDRGGVDAGSPWLWISLAAVVVVLLVVVAKLLPRSPAGSGG